MPLSVLAERLKTGVKRMTNLNFYCPKINLKEWLMIQNWALREPRNMEMLFFFGKMGQPCEQIVESEEAAYYNLVFHTWLMQYLGNISLPATQSAVFHRQLPPLLERLGIDKWDAHKAYRELHPELLNPKLTIDVQTVGRMLLYRNNNFLSQSTVRNIKDFIARLLSSEISGQEYYLERNCRATKISIRTGIWIMGIDEVM